MKEIPDMPDTPEVPDLAGHPTVEAVSFGERSGITGLHHRPEPPEGPGKKARAERTRPTPTGSPPARGPEPPPCPAGDPDTGGESADNKTKEA
jgi:hypothetical protein